MKKLFTLVLSLIAFTSFAQNVPNAGMEDWHNYQANGEDLEAPDDWYGSDAAVFWADTGTLGALIDPIKQVFKSNTEHSGDFAARLETGDVMLLGGGLSGAISTGELTFFGIFVAQGGAPVSERIPYVNAWVKYESGGGNDTGSLVVTAIIPGSNGDSIIGAGIADITESSSYMGISCLVSYTDPDVVPTALQITFYSSKSILNGEEGSTLWVDDVSMSTLSVKSSGEQKDAVKLHPNPSTGIVSIYNTLKEPVTIKAFSANGQEVATKTFTGNDQLDLTAQASGLYFYTVINKVGQQIQHGKLTIAH